MFDGLTVEQLAKRLTALVILVAIGCSAAVWALNEQSIHRHDESTAQQAKNARQTALAAQKTYKASLLSCDRGLRIFSFAVIQAGKLGHEWQEASFHYFQLTDCKETAKLGKQVYLSEAATLKYLEARAKELKLINWDKRSQG